MPDYKTMYFKLFNSVTQAIETLSKAQLEAEKLYIDSSEKDELKLAKLKIVDKKEK